MIEEPKHIQSKTKNHYASYPFDFLEDKDLTDVRSLQPGPFIRFVERYLDDDQRVIDVGCGPGRAVLYLKTKLHRVFAIDLTLEALKLTRSRDCNSIVTCASNLEIPFIDECFDAVVSDGVIHHAPDARRSFCENARILRKGGYLYLAVYRRKRYYYYIYNYLGVPVRWLEKRMWGKAVVHSTMLPFYYLVHLIKSAGKRSWNVAKYLFYDYIITPRATFHTKEEIIAWGEDSGLLLLEYFEKELGNCHAFIFRKK